MQREIDQAVDEAINKGIAEGGMDVIEDSELFVPSQMLCRIIGILEQTHFSPPFSRKK